MAWLVFVFLALGLASLLPSEGYLDLFLFTLLINGTLAVSYDIQAGQLELLSLGHATFFGLGGYIFGAFCKNGASPALAFFLCVLISLGLGYAIALPLARLKQSYFSLASLGLLFLFMSLAYNLDRLTGGANGLYLPQVMDRRLLKPLGYLLLLGTSLLNGWYASSRFGILSRQIEADEDMASSIGIDVARVKRTCLVLSSLPPALAGALFLARTSYLSPDSGFSLAKSIGALMAARLIPKGGVQYVLLGTLLVSLAEEVIWTKFSSFNQTLFGLLLVGFGIVQGSSFKEHSLNPAEREIVKD